MYIYISYLYIYICFALLERVVWGKKKINRSNFYFKSRCEEEKECKEEKKNLNGIYVKKEKCGEGG